MNAILREALAKPRRSEWKVIADHELQNLTEGLEKYFWSDTPRKKPQSREGSQRTQRPTPSPSIIHHPQREGGAREIRVKCTPIRPKNLLDFEPVFCNFIRQAVGAFANEILYQRRSGRPSGFFHRNRRFRRISGHYSTSATDADTARRVHPFSRPA